jgi:integrase
MASRSFGQVRQLPSGRWQARYRHNGQLISAPKPFTRKGDAERWLVKQHAALIEGRRSDGRVTFQVYAERWRRSRPASLSPRTIGDDAWSLSKLASFNSMRLAAITTTDVREWLATMHDSGLTDLSIAKAYRKLNQILRAAVVDGLITTNPCTIRGAGRAEADERPTATVDQVDQLARAVPQRYRAMIYLFAYCSLRWGEVVGLRSRDVDGAIVKVRSRILEQDGHLSRASGAKTNAGVRSITMPDFVVEELRAHMETFCAGDDPDRLLFTSRRGMVLRHGNWSRRVWAPALRDVAGLEDGFKPHDLRHTGNTLAALSGASTRELMARMGQSSFAAALRYQHRIEGRDASIASFLDQLARPTPAGVTVISRRSRKAASSI